MHCISTFTTSREGSRKSAKTLHKSLWLRKRAAWKSGPFTYKGCFMLDLLSLWLASDRISMNRVYVITSMCIFCSFLNSQREGNTAAHSDLWESYGWKVKLEKQQHVRTKQMFAAKQVTIIFKVCFLVNLLAFSRRFQLLALLWIYKCLFFLAF